MRRLLGMALVLCASAAPAAAQSGAFVVGPRGGYITYAAETGIKEGAVLGLDAFYGLTSSIDLGVSLGYARAQTDGSYFPAELTFRDTTMIFAVQQPISAVHVSGLARISLPTGSFRPFLMGGAGLFSVTPDAQTSRGLNRSSDLMLVVGGGIDLRLGSASGLRFEVRDEIYTQFDRESINPVDPRFRPVRFPDVLPAQPPFNKSAHNLSFSAGFTFTPGGQ